jgi:hypothetical protein
VIKSRSRLGGLFRPEDYPLSTEIRDKFGFETKVMPLPDADDFRVSLGDEEKDRVKRQIHRIGRSIADRCEPGAVPAHV